MNSAALARQLEQARALCADARLRTLVGRHAGLRQVAQLDCTIHPQDQMLLHSLRHHGDANAAFSQYFNVGLQQFRAFMQVWRLLGLDRQPGQQVLDFACGYGRLLRFLVPALAGHEVYGAEIQPEALEFVGRQFGVATWPSHYAPDEFEPGQRFDLIWVASLFSHLPDETFAAWLGRLGMLLSPGGVLCFSVHDQCLLPPGETLPASGIRFFGASEIDTLDRAAYGTTYVSEAYVARQIDRQFGPGYGYHRVVRGLAHEQDLYVVAPQGPALDALADFAYGPWGWVDERRLDADGLYLRGWAAGLDDTLLPAVELWVNGLYYRCPTGRLRPDVAQAFSRPELAHSGWEFVLPAAALPPSPPDQQMLVEVRAQDAGGQTALLYAGHLKP